MQVHLLQRPKQRNHPIIDRRIVIPRLTHTSPFARFARFVVPPEFPNETNLQSLAG
jgi:hypothetical protein